MKLDQAKGSQSFANVPRADRNNLSFNMTNYLELQKENDKNLNAFNSTNNRLAALYDPNQQQNANNSRKMTIASLYGSSQNKMAIGTSIELFDSNDKLLKKKEQNLSRGYQSSVSPIMHFGLDSITMVNKILVTWPDGRQQVYMDVVANQQIKIDYNNDVAYACLSSYKYSINLSSYIQMLLHKTAYHQLTGSIKINDSYL